MKAYSLINSARPGWPGGSSSGGWLQAPPPGVYLKRKGRPLNTPPFSASTTCSWSVAYRFQENKNFKKNKARKIFWNFFWKIKFLIFILEFFSVWKIHAHKFFLKTSPPKSRNLKIKIKIFIISKKFLKKIPCFIFFKFLFRKSIACPRRSKSTLYCWACSHSRLLILWLRIVAGKSLIKAYSLINSARPGWERGR